MNNMKNVGKVLKEISIWAVLITAVLKSLGFPINKEIVPISQAVVEAAEQLEILESKKSDKPELLYDFEKEETVQDK